MKFTCLLVALKILNGMFSLHNLSLVPDSSVLRRTSYWVKPFGVRVHQHPVSIITPVNDSISDPAARVRVRFCIT